MADYGKDTLTSRAASSRLAKNLTAAMCSDTVDIDPVCYAFEVYNYGTSDLTIVALSNDSASGPFTCIVPVGAARVFATGVKRFYVTGSGLQAALTTPTANVILHIA